MEKLINSYLTFLIPLAIGLVLLLLGRRVFWALSGAVLAIVGVIIATLIVDPSALQVTLMARGLSIDLADESLPTLPAAIGALVGGVIGIFLTIRVPKVAGAIVGFLCGVLILLFIFILFAFDMPEWVRRSLLIIFGTFVAILALRQPDETMIILTTFLGATTLVQATGLNVNSPLSAFVWLILMLFGITVQTNTLRVQQRKAASRQLVSVPSVPPTTR